MVLRSRTIRSEAEDTQPKGLALVREADPHRAQRGGLPSQARSALGIADRRLALVRRMLAAIADPEAEFSLVLTVAAHDVLRLDGRP
ncbi:hypothetical protein, partial [Streptomyces sp. NPDC048551]|uniref:hypothetical protein n=1 Tax=Streptomyces sp. NPDC048551 TaxID=3155758 RepID=UPI00341F65CF